MGSSIDLQFSFFSHTFASPTIAQSVCGILQSFNRHVPTLYDRTKHCAERDLGNQTISQEREFSDGGDIKYYLEFSMSTFHVARGSSSTHNTHETLSGGQAQSHHNLTFAAYNFVLIFIPTRTHTPQSEYASLTKGLVVGFWGVVLFFLPGTKHGA